ncbi:LacI family transcriptional regulator [Gracilibacillus halotolerans]|uniref:LacI family transcriptional regulator n=1 Tax=Gracilibacillus halotolerans TaxID=74386 RepID=A0A841RDL7_9BACI|nr:LacI family DNA-binding transcriptional regulator [Gracilibacillus halotolerans]MBB6512080.1 LacI family transcriptional regulator [Gracilibacillus halotolerans]
MVTIYDVAKKTGYSITTVSRALNNYSDVSEKTKKVIVKTAEEMGYFPNSFARSLTMKKSFTLGVIFVEDLGVGMKHPFFSAVIEDFKRRVEKFGYDLIFINRYIGNEKKSYIDHAYYRGVDGIIVVCSNYDDPEVVKLIESPLPSVVLNVHTDKTNVVYSNNGHACELVMDHLFSLGHTKIAHIAGASDTFTGKERVNGYKLALDKYDIPFKDTYIVDGGYFSYEGGYEAMNRLLALDEVPTAVFASGDIMAMGAIKAIKDAGLTVPDDVSIVGFDDIELAKHITPSLTTIRQNTELIGKKAADLLINQINNKDEDYSAVMLPVELIVRESTQDITNKE